MFDGKLFAPIPLSKLCQHQAGAETVLAMVECFNKSVKSDFTLRCVTPATNVLQQIGGNLPSCGSRGGKSPPWLLEAIKGTTCPNPTPLLAPTGALMVITRSLGALCGPLDF